MKPGTHMPQAQFSGGYVPTLTHGWVQANPYSVVPFNAAPPPVPQGINPQQWMNGRWQPNPMFQPQAGMTQSGIPQWAPHPGWGVPMTAAQVAQAHAFAQAQANNASGRRVPNPGDANYWSTKLSDNPLGLENMHIRYA